MLVIRTREWHIHVGSQVESLAYTSVMDSSNKNCHSLAFLNLSLTIYIVEVVRGIVRAIKGQSVLAFAEAAIFPPIFY